MKSFAILLLAVTFWAPCSAGPSFDCSRAKSVAEHAICASDDLAFLDNDLSRVYGAALKAGTTTAAEQRGWIQYRDSECKAVRAEECVRNLMWDRYDVLASDLPRSAEETVMVEGEEYHVRQLSDGNAKKPIENLKRDMEKYGELECSRVVEVPSGRKNLAYGAECTVVRKSGTRQHVQVCNASMTNAAELTVLNDLPITTKSLGFFTASNCTGG